MDASLDVDFDEEPTTITYLTIGDKPVNGRTEEVIARINEILLKKVNAKLDLYYVNWSDYLNHYNQTLSSGKADIDLVGTGSDWLDAWPNAFNGNFLPMSEEMLRTFCPRTYSNVTREQWKKCSYNGEIYFIPENEYSQWTNHGFIYRSDIAKEAGLDQVASWDDLNKYVKYVVKNRPDMEVWDADGTNTVVTLGYLMSAGNYAPIYEISTYGLWGAYTDNMGTIVSPYYEGKDLIEFAKLMRNWNDIGVWKSDLNPSESNLEEFFSGISALEQHHTQKYFTEIRPTMEYRQPDSDVKFYWFGEESGNLLKTSILHGATAVYSGSKNPEKALMVYDTLRNDIECYRLLRYGIEGIQYVISSEGMLERPSGFNEERDSIITNFWWGRRDVLEIPESFSAWDDYYELLDSYERMAIDYPWDGIAFATPEIIGKLSSILEICDKYIPEITYAQYECTPEEEVAEFRRELKEAGFEEITKKIQEILNTY